MFQLEEEKTSPTVIKVVGVGGGGMNAVNRMIDADLRGVHFLVMNTDEQVLKKSEADEKLQLGQRTTRGMGAGGDPEMGARAAVEDRDKILQALKGADMVFITAGMGGGTGTGAAPVVADVARELGALTVGVVTLPFQMEGGKRMEFARQGIEALKEKVDTLITIKNDSIFKVIDRMASVDVAFRLVDDILLNAVKGISDLINTAGLVNVDFADVRSIMGETGDAIMGSGEGLGESRVADAVNQAINNALLEETTIEGATALLINVCGGADMSITEWKEVSELITTQVDPKANIIIGLTIDETLKERIRVTVIATGFRKRKSQKERGEMPERMAAVAGGGGSITWRDYEMEEEAAPGPHHGRPVVSVRQSRTGEPSDGRVFRGSSPLFEERTLEDYEYDEYYPTHRGRREDPSHYERSGYDRSGAGEKEGRTYEVRDGERSGSGPRPERREAGRSLPPDMDDLEIPAFLRRRRSP